MVWRQPNIHNKYNSAIHVTISKCLQAVSFFFWSTRHMRIIDSLRRGKNKLTVHSKLAFVCLFDITGKINRTPDDSSKKFEAAHWNSEIKNILFLVPYLASPRRPWDCRMLRLIEGFSDQTFDPLPDISLITVDPQKFAILSRWYESNSCAWWNWLHCQVDCPIFGGPWRSQAFLAGSCSAFQRKTWTSVHRSLFEVIPMR